MTLKFTVPGPFVSGNHAKTRDGRRTAKAREFDEKVRMLCAEAARKQGWTPPDYVEVWLTATNVGIDADNLAKEVLDPLQGIAFPFDSRILRLTVVRFRNELSPRVFVWVSPVDGKQYGFPKPRKKA